ncbi:MAG: pyridoxal phosphate-dependent aminotransferase [Deltaproteobacteria bacterium]|nr:pyridoxal phosphate-dependent aminotransferase [Deltaproteobacteria bacterium]
MTIARHIKTKISGSSWIRKMFEEGSRLRAEHGAENVFDFSLGNPNLEPPEKFRKVLKNTVMSMAATDHGYMPNTGYPHVRKSLAGYLCKEQQVHVTQNDVIMTCGAAGALNVILKAILDPGDEVIAPAPYFVEYQSYAENHGGILKTVSTKPDFSLDIDAIHAAITEKTKAVLINSPNNPTGQVYSKESLDELGTLLKDKGERLNRTLYLISDEPYRKIVYEGYTVPSIFNSYNESIIATSYSKDISIPGERIGYLAVHPEASFNKELMEGMALANRILGFVNAPGLMQRVVASLQGLSVDISAYARKKDILCNGLADCGYDFVEPSGAFYLFPKTPIPDDVKFVQELQKELILTVPGSGFGGPGHFRIAFCVDDLTIKNAMPGFKRVMKKFND